MTALLQDQPIVQQAYGKYQQFNRDERMRALDEAHQRFLHDYASDVEEAQWKKAVEIARNLKRLGVPFSTISEASGLSAIEIDKLS